MLVVLGYEGLHARVYVGDVSWENAFSIEGMYDVFIVSWDDTGVKLVLGVGREMGDAWAKCSFFVIGEGTDIWVNSGVVYCRLDRRNDVGLNWRDNVRVEYLRLNRMADWRRRRCATSCYRVESQQKE
jgi:hypothetical protein